MSTSRETSEGDGVGLKLIGLATSGGRVAVQLARDVAIHSRIM